VPNTHEQGHRGIHPLVEKLEKHQPVFNLIITVETAELTACRDG
jgi:hypothetical protein